MTKSISIMAANTKERRQPALGKMPGHWLIARMGKRVFRNFRLVEGDGQYFGGTALPTVPVE